MRTEGGLEETRALAPAGDFVATLGERVTDLRRTVDTLRADPGSASKRTRFLCRLHALGAAARSLGFFGIAQRLIDMKSVLEAGDATADDLTAIGNALGEIADVTSGELEAPWMPEASPTSLPVTVCVVGDESVEALLRESTSRALAEQPRESSVSPMAFASSRSDDPARVRSELGPYAPELFVIDVDLPGAFDLVRDLIDDPRTDLVPIIAIGGTAEPNGAAQCAALGVTRTFAKPVDTHAFRLTCIDAVEQRRGRTIRMALPPEPGLLPAAPPAVLPARPRPESAGGLRPPPRVPLPSLPVRVVKSVDLSGLAGRRVVVANDEPAVTWFLSDQLRKVGCVVTEALSGADALDSTLEAGCRPLVDLVFAEVGMRGTDGVSLARSMRRDAAARDVPILLLSSKGELLDDARAAGVGVVCMTLGATPEDLSAKAAELLAPRVALEGRMRAGSHASGDLGSTTARRLIATACELGGSWKVRLDDAVFVHDLFVHEGELRRATRTAPNGRVEVAERALATALGTNHGTYEVDTLQAPDIERLPKASDLLGETVRARCAMKRALQGTDVARMARLSLDEDVRQWMHAVSSTSRGALERLANGSSPRLLLQLGSWTQGQLSSLVADLCERGFVLAVRDELVEAAPAEPRPLSSGLEAIGDPPAAAYQPLILESETDVSDSFVASRELTPPPPVHAERPAEARRLELTPPVVPAAPAPASSAQREPPLERPVETPPLPEYPVPGAARSEAPVAASSQRALPPDDMLASSVTAPPPPPPKARPRVKTALALMLGAAAIGLGARISTSGPMAQTSVVLAAAAAPLPPKGPSSPVRLPPEGLLEVTALDGTGIIVDGSARGRGPRLSVTLAEGMHEVQTDPPAQKKRVIEIARGRVTHMDLTLTAPAPPASP